MQSFLLLQLAKLILCSSCTFLLIDCIIRMGVTMMTGGAGYYKRRIPNHWMSQFKIFFIDPDGHLHHGTGNFLFRFFVTGIIRAMCILIFCMTKITGYTQVILEFIYHDS